MIFQKFKRLASDENFFEDIFNQNEVSENEGKNFHSNNISLFNFPEKSEATNGEYIANED